MEWCINLLIGHILIYNFYAKLDQKTFLLTVHLKLYQTWNHYCHETKLFVSVFYDKIYFIALLFAIMASAYRLSALFVTCDFKAVLNKACKDNFKGNFIGWLSLRLKVCQSKETGFAGHTLSPDFIFTETLGTN